MKTAVVLLSLLAFHPLDASAASARDLARALDERLPSGETLGKTGGAPCSVIAGTNVGNDGTTIDVASVQVLTDLDRGSGTFRRSTEVEIWFDGSHGQVSGTVDRKQVDARAGSSSEIRVSEQDQGRVEILARSADGSAACSVERQR